MKKGVLTILLLAGWISALAQIGVEWKAAANFFDNTEEFARFPGPVPGEEYVLSTNYFYLDKGFGRADSLTSRFILVQTTDAIIWEGHPVVAARPSTWLQGLVNQYLIRFEGLQADTVSLGRTDGIISRLYVLGRTLVASGRFNRIGGQQARGLAFYDPENPGWKVPAPLRSLDVRSVSPMNGGLVLLVYQQTAGRYQVLFWNGVNVEALGGLFESGELSRIHAADNAIYVFGDARLTPSARFFPAFRWNGAAWAGLDLPFTDVLHSAGTSATPLWVVAKQGARHILGSMRQGRFLEFPTTNLVVRNLRVNAAGQLEFWGGVAVPQGFLPPPVRADGDGLVLPQASGYRLPLFRGVQPGIRKLLFYDISFFGSSSSGEGADFAYTLYELDSNLVARPLGTVPRNAAVDYIVPGGPPYRIVMNSDYSSHYGVFELTADGWKHLLTPKELGITDYTRGNYNPLTGWVFIGGRQPGFKSRIQILQDGRKMDVYTFPEVSTKEMLSLQSLANQNFFSPVTERLWWLGGESAYVRGPMANGWNLAVFDRDAKKISPVQPPFVYNGSGWSVEAYASRHMAFGHKLLVYYTASVDGQYRWGNYLLDAQTLTYKELNLKKGNRAAYYQGAAYSGKFGVIWGDFDRAENTPAGGWVLYANDSLYTLPAINASITSMHIWPDGMFYMVTNKPFTPRPGLTGMVFYGRFNGLPAPIPSVAGDTPEHEAPVFEAHPNPFNPETSLMLTLPRAGRVQIDVFDLNGRRLATVYSGHQEAGQHRFPFNAARLSSGMYLIRAETPAGVLLKKVTLLK